MGDEHRNTGTVFGIIENLCSLVTRRVKIDLRFLENFQLVIAEIITIVRIWKQK